MVYTRTKKGYGKLQKLSRKNYNVIQRTHLYHIKKMRVEFYMEFLLLQNNCQNMAQMITYIIQQKFN